MARILTVSDSVAAGDREDASGPALSAQLADAGFTVDQYAVVGDGIDEVANALRQLAKEFAGLLVTTGGTGFAPRDLTPEGTRDVIERDAPGFAEAMRGSSPLGPLSRGVAGTVGSTLILNVPGSVKGATESLAAVLDIVPHALDLLAGGHPH